MVHGGRAADGGAADRTRLTDIGRKLARIPVEPRLARMLLAAADTAGKPSLGWRLRTGAEHRAALKDQRVALKAKYSE